MTKTMDCDILVVGAGVAGLCAAMAAARTKLHTILIEKNDEIGRVIKGEHINKKHPIFDKIFEEKAVPKVALLNELTGRRIYSPSAKKYIELQHPEPTVAIDYRIFIIEIFKELAKTDCKVMLNTTLKELIKEDDKVVGAICQSGNEEIKIKSKFIVAADGNHSKIRERLEITSQKMVYPSLKFNFEKLNIPNPHHIELYLIVDPPGAMWMFPKGKTFGEAGLTVWTHDLPNDFDILELWNKKSMGNDRVKNIVKNAKCSYVSRDYLNFGGPVKNIFDNGVVFVGDSGGHVGAIGAAGIISCMSTGYEVSELVSNAILTEGIVTESMIQEFTRNIKKSLIGKYLKKEQSAAFALRQVLFDQFKTAEIIDENWEKLESIMQSQRGDF